MFSVSEIRDKFQRVCIEEGRYLGLIFRMPGEPKCEFGTIYIIGQNDDPERAIITANYIGRVCVAMVEFDRRESAWFAAKRGERIGLIEDICSKIGEAGLKTID